MIGVLSFQISTIFAARNFLQATKFTQLKLTTLRFKFRKNLVS